MSIVFDIYQLFTLQYHCDPLKVLLEKIIIGHNQNVNEIKDLKLHCQQFSKLKELEDKQKNQEAEIKKVRDTNKNNSSQILVHQNSINDLSKYIEDQKSYENSKKGKISEGYII